MRVLSTGGPSVTAMIGERWQVDGRDSVSMAVRAMRRDARESARLALRWCLRVLPSPLPTSARAASG